MVQVKVRPHSFIEHPPPLHSQVYGAWPTSRIDVHIVALLCLRARWVVDRALRHQQALSSLVLLFRTPLHQFNNISDIIHYLYGRKPVT